MGRTVAFTSAAWNYLPKVRALFESIQRHHPEWEKVLVLADAPLNGAEVDPSAFGCDSVLGMADLRIPDLKRWIFFHDVVELSTAIKPHAMRQLLDLPDVEQVLFFDPDVVLFSRLDDLTLGLMESTIVLTPHLVEPEPCLEGVLDNEISALKHGVYNLGFIGVRSCEEARRFSRWWGDRTYHFCVADIPNGLFTDQRWIDLVPAFFEGVRILKEPRFNVAPWNIRSRPLHGDVDTGFRVGEKQLGFYHFTGFDSGAHQQMSMKYGDSDAVSQITRWYSQEVERHSRAQVHDARWGFAVYSDGVAIPRAHRRIYRARLDLQRTFCEPFITGPGSLREWMDGQGPQEHPKEFELSGQTSLGLSRPGRPRPGWFAWFGAGLGRAIREPAWRRQRITYYRRVWNDEGFVSLLARLMRLR